MLSCLFIVITCWKRADLLGLLCMMFSCAFVTFPYDVPDQMWYLIVSIPDTCLLLYFYSNLYKVSLTSFFPQYNQKTYMYNTKYLSEIALKR